MKKGKIFVISGPSGVGKGTIVNELIKDELLNFYWAKSYTTRPHRQSDRQEDHYIFVDKKKFKNLQKSGEILEANFYDGNWYGSSKSEIDKGLNSGRNVIKEVEVNGAMFYKKAYPKAILIFIKADLSDIKKRLINRKQNTPTEISQRLDEAISELKLESEYNYSVKNKENEVQKAILDAKNIIKKETF